MTTNTAATFSKESKVTLGILGTLIAGVAGGAFYMSSVDGNLVHVAETLQEVKEAINKNTDTLNRDGKSLAVMTEQVRMLSARIDKIEAR